MSLDDEDDNDANVIPIYDQKIFNYCGRIKISQNISLHIRK